MITVMLDGVLLDWEGVLADTGAARRESMLRALTDEGVPFGETDYDECGLGRSVHVAAALIVGRTTDDPTLAELVALRAQRQFASRIGQGFALRPGAARFIELAQLRAPIAIVTTAGRVETDAALRLAGVHDACAAIVTADDVPGVAPSRELFDEAMSRLARRRSVHADRVVALVTNEFSIRAARSAGVRTVALAVPAHVALEADAALSSLDELSIDDLISLAGLSLARPA